MTRYTVEEVLEITKIFVYGNAVFKRPEADDIPFIIVTNGHKTDLVAIISEEKRREENSSVFRVVTAVRSIGYLA